ncbi:hypothetical protein AB4Z30_15700 [Paenibacillus sp. 2TAF8]|jgi:hypothetical protein|uniref:hypothetical protein n=1 Tax=Paenibacillus sp. 2TAF8 TaxID=3233020 RepID=UPI003F95E7ED
MRKTMVFGMLGILVLLFAGILIYRQLAPSINAQDVTVSGTILSLDSKTVEVVLHVIRTKEEDEQHMTFPIIPGWGGISFTGEQANGWFRPSSVGTSYDSQVILEQAEQQEWHNVDQLKQVFSQELVGFSLPKEIGTYNMSFTLKALDEIPQTLQDPKVYYVHNERLLGKNLSWAAGYKLDILKEGAK